LGYSWYLFQRTPDIISNADIQGVSEIIIAKAIEKYKIPREKLVILTKCFGTVYDDPGSTAGSENTKEYVNKHGIWFFEYPLKW
jgi:aryl-alcohol dehydrogenase-like predicted oxidoreductase